MYVYRLQIKWGFDKEISSNEEHCIPQKKPVLALTNHNRVFQESRRREVDGARKRIKRELKSIAGN
jgi:hypothetical protein